ncbi:MAG: transcription termination factor Rho [Actinomycetota bacterium]|nr:transcription termination factor Rho [Actinomycetota bacterium]
MSIAPQALERSVLERKERDELAAIATAMGVKASGRASKSTLIDSILREAGIETGGEERPKRPRASKAAATSDRDSASVNGASERPAGRGDGPAAVIAPPAPVTEPDVDPDAEPTTRPVITPPSREPSPSPDDEPSPAEAGSVPERNAGSVPEPKAGSVPEPKAGSGGGAAAGADRSASSGNGRGTDSEAMAGGFSDGSRQSAGGQQAGSTRTDDRQRNRDNRGAGQGQAPGQGPDNAGEGGNRRSSSRRRRGRDRGDRVMVQQERVDDVQFSGEPSPVEGLLDLHDKGYGFLRTAGYLASAKDVYVSVSQVRRFGLRKGDYVKGASRPAGNNESWPALLRIDTVSDMTPDEARQRPRFEDLTPLFPDARLHLEVSGDSTNMVSRIVDLISPIGKGQRGLIVSPPKAGKTTVLKQIAHSIEKNNPEIHLMVLLVDERPEEVTDMRRSVKGEVVASTFDKPSEEHTQVAELTLERAKRLVEVGTDVCIVLDGITRLSRAYNLAAPATGRIMSGGIDVGALYPPKKFFGSARNVEEGGSLTILATALVETGSRMDEVIFEEFKGTGNMELRLDRKLAERRIYPALDVNGSSTRHEELLFERNQLQQVWKLRRVLNALEGGAGLELLMDKIRNTKSNDEFLAEIAKAPAG